MVEIENLTNYIKQKYKVNDRVAKNLAQYMLEQYKYLLIPKRDELLIEVYPHNDIEEYIFHTVLGRKANDALSRAFAYLISKEKRTNVRTVVSDYGFSIIVPKEKALKKVELLGLLSIKEDKFEEILREAIKNSEMFKRVFRHVANTGLMILKKYMGKEIPISRQQINAESLLNFLLEHYPDFPLLKETYRTILEDKMDIFHAKEFMRKVKKMKIYIKEVEMPSPFAWHLEVWGQSDIIFMQDKKEMIKRLHKKLLRKIKE
ncbi:NEQ409 [Nanoarchaeum equitans Kin4-M]|uniref:NEQ409 n=1 Tax=Nanoarchaeum equitans (strain Kin4-M) TaxID=228908 RepID=Q74ME4_NANEQ|nr:NEQ409 [Nanoarchaeum equitans Kin4-M]